MNTPPIETPYGYVNVREDRVVIVAYRAQLYAWANRTGARWPCADLPMFDQVVAAFDRNGLCDLECHDHSAERVTTFEDESHDVGADEFNAWSSDVLRDVLPLDHPVYYVAVGQFA